MRSTLIAIALLLAGCGTLTDFHRAETLDPGATEVGVELSAFGVTDTGSLDGLPGVAVTSRHGLAEGFELGLRMGTMGVAVTGKWRLYDDGVIIAAAPTLDGFSLGSDTWWVGLQAPLLVELPFGADDAHGVVFSPRAQVQYIGLRDFFGSGGGTSTLASAGLGVGLALKLGPVTLMPEVALTYPITAINPDGEVADGIDEDGSVILLFQAGLGVRWHFGG